MSRFFFLLLLVALGAGIILFFLFGRDLPKHESLRHYEPPVMNRLYTADGQLLQEYALEKRLFVPFHAIPQRIKDAFLSAEDHHFYEHFGLDVGGMIRAFAKNTLTQSWGSRPGGASTITQQVAKNFLIGNERSMNRKIKEAILSLRIEYSLPKDRIFELYLNQIYLGGGAYGIAAAALTFFNKELEQLTIDEAAFLAALAKAPSRLIQSDEPERLKNRRDWVIDRMFVDGKLTSEQATHAKNKPLIFQRYREKPIRADYFADEVRRQLRQKFGHSTIQEGGLTVRTTIEPELQAIADQSLRQGLIAYDRRHGWRGPLDKLPTELVNDSAQWLPALKGKKRPPGIGPWQLSVVTAVNRDKAKIGLTDGSTGWIYLSQTRWAASCLPDQKVGPAPQNLTELLHAGDIIAVSHSQQEDYRLEQIPQVTGALVVIDHRSGRVLALTGGYDFSIHQFNCATQAFRQPGSCFKPFVYLVGLEDGMTPDTPLLDAPISISLGADRGHYSPKNYNNKYSGLSPLRVGLEQSRNTMTIRLAQKLGMARIIETAEEFGIMEKMPKQIAMVLGAGSTTVMKLTAAYATIANDGIQVHPHLIDWAQDRYGNTLYSQRLTQDQEPAKRLATSESIAQLVPMLFGVTQHGTARSLNALGFPVAGKTGSTNNFTDAWYVGFTDTMVVGVFVGFPSPRTLGEGETGSRVAVPICHHFMEQAYVGKEPPHFEDINTIIDAGSSENIMSEIDEDPLYIFEEEGGTEVVTLA